MGLRRLEVFLVALKLGLTSFGGPVAHLGYFRSEYVVRRRWLDEAAFADLVALCQALPGPTSSQVGMAMGRLRAGTPGAFLAWLGFTLPSALLMAAFAAFWRLSPWDPAPLVRGLELAALAVVAQAAWSMGRTLARGRRKAVLALASAAALAWFPSPATQPAVLAAAGLAGFLLFREPAVLAPGPTAAPLPRTGGVWIGVALALLVLLPAGARLSGSSLAALADSFYRAGSLVFGGGHVVLPLLQAELVGPGRLDASAFLAGYGFAQTVPGPLFTVSAYLGYLGEGPVGAVVALVAIFLPSFLVLGGILPLWDRWKARPGMRAALAGANAAVVGFLAWAVVDPLGVQALRTPADGVLALGLLAALAWGKVPPWAVVGLGVALSMGLGAAGW